MRTGGAARTIGAAVSGGDVTTGTGTGRGAVVKDLAARAAEVGLDGTTEPAVVRGAAVVVVGSCVVAGPEVIPGAAATPDAARAVLCPDPERAATMARNPAPATAEAVTARVIMVSRRMARSRAATRSVIGRPAGGRAG